MKTLGINIGSSSIKLAVLEGSELKSHFVRAHEGNVRNTLLELIKEAGAEKGMPAIVTGPVGRKQVALPDIIEPVAIERVLEARDYKVNAVVCIGGEDLVVYTVNDQGRIENTFAGNKCASGTGEFFLQQLLRMDMRIDDVAKIEGGSVKKMSSRCSVFMKSDCTHKLNKNEATKEDIVVSLSYVMAKKVTEYLTRAKVNDGRILITGGVAANKFLIQHLRDLMPDADFQVPAEASYFEAYGAAVIAAENGGNLPADDDLFNEDRISFEKYSSMKSSLDRVDYIDGSGGDLVAGREYILGVDGGSTTTKVALVDYETSKICASHYGRTHGNPIEALRKCLQIINKDIQEKTGGDIRISLVSVTGSSRELLSVFCETGGVYNEIIAHATGTSFYNKDIDTIFEIGGQDAKYVLLKNGVPIDYAMNEACSAGTGSFLEESASGDLDITDVHDIGKIAMEADAPLKFGEHCSAFINSDIRKAIQEGASKSNITGGIIFSIVSNYLNRVVGNRTIGKKAVIQGGVAKNPAIPLAFAALMNRDIIVPPFPELMGCFGVALLARQKYEDGLLDKSEFSIDSLIANEVSYGKEFTCHSCKNYCSIATIIVNGNKYQFGGRCNKYANMRRKTKIDADKVANLVNVRNELIFEKHAADFSDLPDKALTVGVPRIFSVFNLWPLYSHFFHRLGVFARLSDKIDEAGIEKCESDFCYPGEIAHGEFQDCVNADCDYYFLPHFKDMPSYEEDVHATLCPIIQGMPYYLRSTFGIPDNKILRPIVTFNDGFDKGEKTFISLAKDLGFSADEGRKAFRYGLEKWHAYHDEVHEIGRKFLEERKDSDKPVIALFGRPYNVLNKSANMGIPRKFETRGYDVIPYDFFPISDENIPRNMYWFYGQQNLKTAKMIKKMPNVFLAYVSNFSCAPDSFILHIIRWLMGEKPYLVLELDSHSADAGVDTRIEAFLDIIEGYRRSLKPGEDFDFKPKYQMVFRGGNSKVIDNETGKLIELDDPRITFVWPSMGNFSTTLISAFCEKQGLRSTYLPVSDAFTTQLARDVASGKECIPTLLVLGSVIKFLAARPDKDDSIYLIIVPYTTGPCRTGQYANFFERTFHEMGIKNLAMLTLNSDNSYTELGPSFSKNAWWALVIADIFKDIETGLRVMATDREKALAEFHEIWEELVKTAKYGKEDIMQYLRRAAERFKKIPRDKTLDDIKKVMIVGEIYVRRDDFSVSELLDNLADKGIFGKIAGITEWFNYTDYVKEKNLKARLGKKSIFNRYFSKKFMELLYLQLLEFPYKKHVEHKVMDVMKPTGLIPSYPHKMKKIMKRVHDFSHPNFETETSVSLCVAAEAMNDGYAGVVSMAPFACLPGRLIKSIFNPYARDRGYPFISLENDGFKYPPSILNRLELFMLNVLRYEKGDVPKNRETISN